MQMDLLIPKMNAHTIGRSHQLGLVVAVHLIMTMMGIQHQIVMTCAQRIQIKFQQECAGVGILTLTLMLMVCLIATIGVQEFGIISYPWTITHLSPANADVLTLVWTTTTIPV
jgi:hypothetical protein